MIYSGTSTTVRSATGLEQSSWVITPTPPPQKPCIPTTLEPPCTIGDDISFFDMDRQSLYRLDCFRHQTAISLGTPSASGVYQEISYSLARGHPFLMHSVQTLTVCHDRYLALHAGVSSQRTPAEAYHLARAASLFNQKLCEPIANCDKDALWATAALLGIAATSSIEASSAYEAWPLTPYADTDLDWLRMSESKSAIWELTDHSEQTAFSALYPVSIIVLTTKLMKSLICRFFPFTSSKSLG